VAVLNVTDARTHLPALLDRVDQGEEVTITRHGRPVAVLVSPSALRARRADGVLAEAEAIGQLLDEPAAGLVTPPALSPERADELAAGLRDERSRSSRD
jgi:prevent-host-death family protein